MKGRSLLHLLCLPLSIFAATAVQTTGQLPADSVRPALLVSLTMANAHQTVFDLTLTPPDTRPSAAGRRFNYAGTERIAEPGMPDLPAKTVLVGLPQTGNIRLSAESREVETFSGIEIPPATGPWEAAIAENPDMDAATLPETALEDWFPRATAELIGIEMLRGVRVARVRIYPVQYNASTRSARVHRHIRIRIDCSEPASENPSTGGLDPLIRDLLVNGEQAVHWKTDLPDPDSINFFERAAVWCRIEIETTGIYRITPEDLRKAGFSPASLNPSEFRLFTLGKCNPNGPYPDTMLEVPILVKDNGDSRFSSNDFIAFYAQGLSRWDDSMVNWQTNLFARYNCYWLTWGLGAGRRMNQLQAGQPFQPRSSAPARVRLETDSLCPARSGLLWLWEEVTKPAGPFTDTLVRRLVLPARDTITSIRGRLYGRSPSPRLHPKYPVAVRLNGVLLDTLIVSGEAQAPPPCDFRFENLAGATLRPYGVPATLSFELRGDGAADVFLDWLEVDYLARLELSPSQPALEFYTRDPAVTEFTITSTSPDLLVLDVTDPWQPQQIAGSLNNNRFTFRSPGAGFARFSCCLVSHLRRPVSISRRDPGRLRAVHEHIHYYVVAPDEFYPAARLLARYRENNVPGITGARVEAVRLSDIYDDYGFGREEPGAIKKFFASKRPEYGLLAADGLFDYKNNLRLSNLSPFIPPYEIGYDIDPEVYGVVAKALDAWYADFDGNGSSPDMILGRVTARSAFELRTFLDKVRRYETQHAGLWTRRFLLLGDDEYLGSPDEPESFVHIIHGCEPIAVIADTLFEPVKVYLTEYPLVKEDDKPGARAELKRQLDAGALIWAYFGHGAGFRLAHEQALNIEGVPDIHNGSRIPFAFFGSCGVGRFEDIRYQAIAEELVRKEDGCIATMGATKATSSPGNEAFAQTLYPYLLSHPELPIGAAFYQAWSRVNNLYHFFGDPATRLRLPQPQMQVAIAPDTFYPGGAITMNAQSPDPQGGFDFAAFESEMQRYYTSDLGAISYRLLGNTIYSGGGRFQGSTILGSFLVPRAPYPETVPASMGNGYYARVPNSCRVSMVANTAERSLSGVLLRIPLSNEPVASEDNDPPEITLVIEGRTALARETTQVPRRFTATGYLRDQSGIYLLPSPAESRFSWFLGDPTQDSSLVDRFEYDANTSFSGRFRLPIQMRQVKDSLVITVSDNVQNRRRSVWHLRADLSTRLNIDSALVYPNPVAREARFTFLLNRAAAVSVRIYTLSGRRVRSIPNHQCGFGYNEIHWDGTDEAGIPVPNGIYLYRLEARSIESTTGQLTTAGTKGTFIVHH
ncbi:MAG: C25 family cysteine peptidase [candidate division WOR-3 bacterium]